MYLRERLSAATEALLAAGNPLPHGHFRQEGYRELYNSTLTSIDQRQPGDAHIGAHERDGTCDWCLLEKDAGGHNQYNTVTPERPFVTGNACI